MRRMIVLTAFAMFAAVAVWQLPSHAQQPVRVPVPAYIPKWEYQMVDSTRGDVLTVLNNLGKEGWEVCGNPEKVIVLKRSLVQHP